MNAYIYKVTNAVHGRYWILRMPRFVGWILDRYHRLRHGFIP